MTYAISSAQNERLKRVAGLREKKHRKESGTFLIEGVRELHRAIASGFDVQELYYSGLSLDTLWQHKEWQGKPPRHLAKVAFSVAPQAFPKIAMRESGADVVAVARLPQFMTAEQLIGQAATLLVLDAVEKPGNIGAILRSMDGAGISGLLVSGLMSEADFFNPNLIRASVGAAFSVKAASAEPQELLALLQQRNYQLVAALPDAKTNYYAANLRGKIALVLGSEAFGVSEFWAQHATQGVAIPMRGIGDSLNVSVAAAILCYDLLRQASPDVSSR
jgi:TrmH family RNA methyltransferase